MELRCRVWRWFGVMIVLDGIGDEDNMVGFGDSYCETICAQFGMV